MEVYLFALIVGTMVGAGYFVLVGIYKDVAYKGLDKVEDDVKATGGIITLTIAALRKLPDVVADALNEFALRLEKFADRHKK